jgi:hypothetical protein
MRGSVASRNIQTYDFSSVMPLSRTTTYVAPWSNQPFIQPQGTCTTFDRHILSNFLRTVADRHSSQVSHPNAAITMGQHGCQYWLIQRAPCTISRPMSLCTIYFDMRRDRSRWQRTSIVATGCVSHRGVEYACFLLAHESTFRSVRNSQLNTLPVGCHES